jgi:hypothetical protein
MYYKNMGSGSSVTNKNIECPENYNSDDFNIILELFKKLDINNNDILELEELKVLSNNHIKNRIKLLNSEKVRQIEINRINIDTLKQKKELKIKELNDSFNSKKNNHNSNLSINLKRLDINIKNLEQMGEEEKGKRFVNIISYNKKDIDFWRFFLYMKNKIEDIKTLNN